MAKEQFTGRYFINGIDIYTNFGIGVTIGGMEELERWPKRKEQYARVFKESNGTQRSERYNNKLLFESKSISLQFCLVFDNREDYLSKSRSFRDFLLREGASGYFRLYCTYLDSEYTLLYDDNSDVVIPFGMFADNGDVVGDNWVFFNVNFIDDNGLGKSGVGIPDSYGVRWKKTNADSKLERVGNMKSHQDLPAHKALKGCILKSNGEVNYYLDAKDWTKKADGKPSKLDGTDGDVMVEIPDLYFNFIESNTHNSVYVSLNDNGGKLYKKRYVSAYEPTLERSTNTMRSVMNATDDYKGHTGAKGNLAPFTNVARGVARGYARKRVGYELMDITTYSILVWLYFIEYANRNSQLPVPNGLGNGLTTLNASEWVSYNNQHGLPIIGKSNSLGNNSGEVNIGISEFPSAMMNRYRGIENFFGHISKLLDGIMPYRDFNKNTFEVFVSENSELWNDSNHNGYDKAGELPLTSGYIKDINFPLFTPKTTGGSSTTFYCDNYYSPTSKSEYKWYGTGGAGASGSNAGVGYAIAADRVLASDSFYGFRLTYLTK